MYWGGNLMIYCLIELGLIITFNIIAKNKTTKEISGGKQFGIVLVSILLVLVHFPIFNILLNNLVSSSVENNTDNLIPISLIIIGGGLLPIIAIIIIAKLTGIHKTDASTMVVIGIGIIITVLAGFYYAIFITESMITYMEAYRTMQAGNLSSLLYGWSELDRITKEESTRVMISKGADIIACIMLMIRYCFSAKQMAESNNAD